MDLIQLIQAVGFPAVMAILVLRYLSKANAAQVEAENKRVELENERQKGENDLTLKQMEAFNNLAKAIDRLANANQARTDIVEGYRGDVQSYKTSVDELVERHDAVLASQPTLHKKMDDLPAQVINGVKTELQQMEQRLGNIETAVQDFNDSQMKMDIQRIRESIDDFARRYDKVKTDELKPVTTPDTPPTAAEGGA